MQSKRKYIINVGVCFLLLVLPVLLLDNFEITFDAAMNFDVSKNLVKYGEYATFAFEWISVTFCGEVYGVKFGFGGSAAGN